MQFNEVKNVQDAVYRNYQFFTIGKQRTSKSLQL